MSYYSEGTDNTHRFSARLSKVPFPFLTIVPTSATHHCRLLTLVFLNGVTLCGSFPLLSNLKSYSPSRPAT